jgi:hypothetical protein
MSIAEFENFDSKEVYLNDDRVFINDVMKQILNV